MDAAAGEFAFKEAVPLLGGFSAWVVIHGKGNHYYTLLSTPTVYSYRYTMIYLNPSTPNLKKS